VDDGADHEAPPRQVDISRATIVRVLAAAVVVWLWLRLWRWLLIFVVSAFIAIALDPIVTSLERRGWRRGYAAPLVVLALASILAGFIYVCGSSLLTESRELGDRLTTVQHDIAAAVPPELGQLIPAAVSLESVSRYVLVAARALITGLLLVAAAFLLTAYLLVDGRRTYEWVTAFVPQQHRERVHKTAEEARKSIRAYVHGNVLTSVFATVFAGVVLTALQVPAALLLAVLAGVCDFLPVVGFVLSAGPAVLMAMTVSATATWAVAGAYALYHVVENYYIGPKVYGRELRLSDLAVVVAFAIGAELGGVVGALIVLPLAAIYPVIERVWLGEALGSEVRVEHRRVEKSAPH
jgi:predicted PurR-regulated permease PerM